MTDAKPSGRRRSKVLIVVGLFACLVGSCYARWPAKSTGLQKKFNMPDGRAVTFTLWEAERVLKLPFFDGTSAYVRFDGKRVRIHGGGFGAAVGNFLVSPQRDVVIVERTFEGGATSGLLVDLQTGKYSEWSLFSNNPSVTGWSEESWRTSHEAVPRERLHQQLASAEFESVKLAMDELRARGFDDADWLAMARVVADTHAPSRARDYLAFSMVHSRHEHVDHLRRQAHFGSSTMPAAPGSAEFDYSSPPKVDWPDEIIRLFESVQDDPDPEIREEVRSALEQMRRKTDRSG